MKKILLLIVFAGFAHPTPARPQSQSAPRPSPFTLHSSPSPRNELGKPFLTNWLPKDYRAHKQNWTIVQDGRGVMYFGNGNGVLEYDGVTWRRISLPNESWALSLAIDRNGRIYVGSETEFGYLLPDSVGEVQYVSLMAHVPEQYRDFGDVWQTLATSHGIYFSTSKYLFRWKNSLTASGRGDLQIWKPENSFHVAFLVGDKPYVRQRETGLMELAGDSLRLVPGGERFANERNYAILPFDRDRILVGTRTQGLFLYDGETFQPFNTQADAFLQENQLYHGAVLADGTFALATLRGGLAIIDKQGRLQQIVSKISGLQNENIWFLYPDREGALWLALDNGLARVETPAPFSLYSEQLGINGSVEAILRHQGRLYAATSQGVSFMSSPTPTGKFPIFQSVSGIATQSWSLLSVDNTLLAATSDGVFRIEGDRATQRVCDLFSYFLYRSRQDSSRVYAGLNDGLALLHWKNGNWHFAGRVPGISGEVRSIVEDEEDVLWLGTSQQGVLRMKIPPRQPGLGIDNEAPEVEIERYTEEDGIPRGWVHVFLVKKRARFATAKGLRYFDLRSQSFLPDSTFGKTFADTARWISHVIEDKQGRLLIRSSDQNRDAIGAAAPQEDGAYTWNITPFLRISEYGKMLAIYPDPGHPGVVWFGGDEGIVRYDPAVAKDYSVDYSALIRRVTVNLKRAGGDSVIFGGTIEYGRERSQSFPTLRYANNALRFEFAAPSYDDPSANLYQIFLEGFDKNWSEWTDETKKDYTNLAEGDYHFRVRAKNVYDHVSQEVVYAFTILPPWWRTWWAYGGYAVMLGLLVFAVDRVQRRRLIKKERARSEIRETKLRAQAVEAENKALQAENARKKNVELLSEIGKDITASLDIDTIFYKLYEHVNQLADASSFGVGIYHPEKQQIEYRLAIEKGKRYAPYTRDTRAALPASAKWRISIICSMKP